MLARGPFALISLAKGAGRYGCASYYLLIDDETGKRREFHVGGRASGLLALGAPWALFSGTHGVRLYNITTRRMQTLNCCVDAQGNGSQTYAVGSRWLEFVVQTPGSCGDGVHNSCGPLVYHYYNLTTHRARIVQPSPSSIVDLDSRDLVKRVCAPLTVPRGGTLDFYPPFAVATTAFSATGSTSTLERCGTRLSLPVSQNTLPQGNLVANGHAVLWAVDDARGGFTGQFNGLLLPSLRSFTFPVPAALAETGILFALDSYRLYLTGPDHTVWAASFPPTR